MLYIICICDIICLKGREFMNTVLLSAVIILLIVCLVLLIRLGAKKDGSSNELLKQQIELSSKATDDKILRLSEQMDTLTDKNYKQQIELMKTLNDGTQKQMQMTAQSLERMQQNNEKKLEQMRKTVDEKLDETLTQRLNSSFETVSKQLKDVYKSLGEMKELSSNITDSVGSLNRVLTNVKARGTWAEVQLQNILDQTIANMYETNVQTNPNYNGRVEFAVKIPNGDNDEFAYLPIDSKFPMEDYARLAAASEAGDVDALAQAKKALEVRVKDEAKLIKQYVCPPNTTPFAIMYLATEGLYAQIISSKTGIAEALQAQGIMVAGPSTVTALLNSLAMGFKTVAINKKANEVYKVLGAAKAQYDKFGIVLAKARKKVEEAGKTLEDAESRNRIIQKNLKSVESLSADKADQILGLEFENEE